MGAREGGRPKDYWASRRPSNIRLIRVQLYQRLTDLGRYGQDLQEEGQDICPLHLFRQLRFLISLPISLRFLRFASVFVADSILKLHS